MMLEKMKRTSIKGSKFKPKTIFWAHASDKKSSEFMLEKF
jgi:hypothetical protein